MHNNLTTTASLYPIGGIFVTYLLKKSTPAQFKSIIKNQTIANARKVYGNERFEQMIARFDAAMSGDDKKK